MGDIIDKVLENTKLIENEKIPKNYLFTFVLKMRKGR